MARAALTVGMPPTLDAGPDAGPIVRTNERASPG